MSLYGTSVKCSVDYSSLNKEEEEEEEEEEEKKGNDRFLHTGFVN